MEGVISTNYLAALPRRGPRPQVPCKMTDMNWLIYFSATIDCEILPRVEKT
jgi:hypothetical protein